MSALAHLQAERSRMSATDRKIADFILGNAPLLRDYSSQQLADVVKVSQSSVVKFAQRLGFDGYPDLKLSVNEAVTRAAAESEASAGGSHAPAAAVEATGAEALWSAKAAAELSTRQRNDADMLDTIAAWLAGAGRVYLAGSGVDGDAAGIFADRLGLLGCRCTTCRQPGKILAKLASATEKDVLVVIDGGLTGREWLPACREIRSRGGRLVTITWGRRRWLAGMADGPLVVVAHAPEPHVEELAYEAAMRHLLDSLFLRIFTLRPKAAETFAVHRRRPRDSATAASRHRL